MHWLLRALTLTPIKQLAHQVHPGEASAQGHEVEKALIKNSEC